MATSKLTPLPRWQFDINVPHECECCGNVCNAGEAVCPKCRTRLGEFSRPLMLAQVPETPKVNGAQPAQASTEPAGGIELLTRCPHCQNVLSLVLK